jgi:hypothetical protein
MFFNDAQCGRTPMRCAARLTCGELSHALRV